jgi:hypothetical protein
MAQFEQDYASSAREHEARRARRERERSEPEFGQPMDDARGGY